MSITNEQKQEIIAKYGTKPNDTGSPEVQIAIWTYRINSLIEHFNVHKKDLHFLHQILLHLYYFHYS